MTTDILAPVVGDPSSVLAAGHTLASIAAEVDAIAGKLQALASGSSDWLGAAANAAHARSATLPPKLARANTSYAAAGSALGSYAQALEDAQQQSALAIASAAAAREELAAAQAAQAAASARDAAAAAAAQAANVPAPPATAPRYAADIEAASQQLARASALNEQAHDVQAAAARVASGALHDASSAGIHNASWFHRVTHAVTNWASTQWSQTLSALAKIANVVSAVAGVAALALAVAGVIFPPLEAAAGVLETISLVSAVVAGVSDTVLAASGKGSWTEVGITALTLAPMGAGKLVSKAAPWLRDAITPSAVVHASDGTASGLAAREYVSNVAAQARPRWASAGTLVDHLARHGADFGATTSADYVDKGADFLQRAIPEQLPTKVGSDGVIRVYEPATNTFGSYDGGGSIKTFYKPNPLLHRKVSNWAYWQSQKGVNVIHGH